MRTLTPCKTGRSNLQPAPHPSPARGSGFKSDTTRTNCARKSNEGLAPHTTANHANFPTAKPRSDVLQPVILLGGVLCPCLPSQLMSLSCSSYWSVTTEPSERKMYECRWLKAEPSVPIGTQSHCFNSRSATSGVMPACNMAKYASMRNQSDEATGCVCAQPIAKTATDNKMLNMTDFM
jgi:hypothetical protein